MVKIHKSVLTALFIVSSLATSYSQASWFGDWGKAASRLLYGRPNYPLEVTKVFQEVKKEFQLINQDKDYSGPSRVNALLSAFRCIKTNKQASLIRRPFDEKKYAFDVEVFFKAKDDWFNFLCGNNEPSSDQERFERKRKFIENNINNSMPKEMRETVNEGFQEAGLNPKRVHLAYNNGISPTGSQIACSGYSLLWDRTEIDGKVESVYEEVPTISFNSDQSDEFKDKKHLKRIAMHEATHLLDHHSLDKRFLRCHGFRGRFNEIDSLNEMRADLGPSFESLEKAKEVERLLFHGCSRDRSNNELSMACNSLQLISIIARAHELDEADKKVEIKK